MLFGSGLSLSNGGRGETRRGMLPHDNERTRRPLSVVHNVLELMLISLHAAKDKFGQEEEALHPEEGANELVLLQGLVHIWLLNCA